MDVLGVVSITRSIRGFHLDRIRHLEITAEVFPERDPAVLDTDLSRWRSRRLG